MKRIWIGRFARTNLKSALRNYKSAIMCAMLFALCTAAHAQQSTKLPRIGYLNASSLSTNATRMEAFRYGLRELNYVEGKAIVIEWRSADGKSDRLAALAAELVRLPVKLIVTGGSTSTRAAKAATSTIPIVMTNDPDPVGDGLVASLARPSGNITGLSTLAPELGGKRLEILREIVPKLSRVAVLGTSTQPGLTHQLRELELAAKAFGVKLQNLDVLDSKDIETAFRTANKGQADGLVVLTSPILSTQRTQLVHLAVKHRLPAMYSDSRYVEVEGLMTYSVSFLDLDQRAATYVDKILKGAKPADLPIEQPKKFEFIINLKAAKQIGLTIPPNVLARADRVIR
ncbi:MAG TPA: ABC transporter substrate-binding protein [Candidatus Binatia bacterium]|jgi:putative ABC transport system substrate-binding protein|nr:ABC transporter substrate-binding protein [Candidatus Binatia bacterium]